jgi:hypothetical protein
VRPIDCIEPAIIQGPSGLALVLIENLHGLDGPVFRPDPGVRVGKASRVRSASLDRVMKAEPARQSAAATATSGGAGGRGRGGIGSHRVEERLGQPVDACPPATTREDERKSEQGRGRSREAQT